VFHAGPSQNMNWYTTGGDGGRRAGGTRPGGDQMNGNAVMYAQGKILACGGALNYEQNAATSAASVITLAGNTASARATTPMAFARAFHMSVVLPDGKVVTVGGMPFPVPFDDTNAVLPAGAPPPLDRLYRPRLRRGCVLRCSAAASDSPIASNCVQLAPCVRLPGH
jgi:hypothetical protein